MVDRFSEQEEGNIKGLMEKPFPSYRKAYSDRTAAMMARMAELAYLRFNVLLKEEEKKNFLEKADVFLGGQPAEEKLVALVKGLGKKVNPTQEKRDLRKELKIWGLKLLRTFDQNGTQAFLAVCKEYAVLAFRGTEVTEFQDIKDDMNAILTKSGTDGFVHKGFQKAYKRVEKDIHEAIQHLEVREKPLYFTGHSLGGALATIAAKEISHTGGNAACYTFGAPRVGDEAWVVEMKTPVYRVVNSADSVPMLPPGKGVTDVLSWGMDILPIPILQTWKKLMFAEGRGYYHCGNMRFLTNCPPGDYGTVNLLYSVTFWRRVVALTQRVGPGFLNELFGLKKLVADHSIKVYRKKLMVIAKRRNRDKDEDKGKNKGKGKKKDKD